MKVEIWSDIACPWCYIGKRRFERALASFSHRDEVDVVWRSFELDPRAPRRHAEPQAALLARKYHMPLAQAQAMNARMTLEARREGLAFDMDRVRVGNTFDAHRLIHFAATTGRREAAVERLFLGYFTRGEALGDTDVLVRVAADAGLDTRAARRVLEGNAFAGTVRADEARAHALGIASVPFFAIDECYGVSGAQAPEVLLDALRQAWGESHAEPITAGGAPAEGCADGSCAI